VIAALRRAYEALRGFDPPGTTVPAMDGPLRPNTRLDEARLVLELPDVDNLVVTRSGLLCAQGADLLTLRFASDGTLAMAGRETLPAPITCLAASSDGTLAVGLDGRGLLLRGGPHDGRVIDAAGNASLNAPTAATFLEADTLAVCNGSTHTRAADWKRDLMSKGASGSVSVLDLTQRNEPGRLLARNLAFPAGVASDGAGGLFVSEAWRHRVLRLDLRSGAKPSVVLDELPAYPGRIAPSAQGYWLALFAPRNPLVEFVLGETLYRTRMMDRVPMEYWIAPSLIGGKSFLEPIQGGARKKLNQLKPWSPSWSYGLVARVDRTFALADSLHSRADGRVHGVTAACEHEGKVFIAAKGAGRIVEVAA
jgi:hypothetical protein